MCLAGESKGCKNDCEDTADNIGDNSASGGDNAPFFLMKIRAL